MKKNILILIGVVSFIFILTINTNVLEGFAISGLGLLDNCPDGEECNIIREGGVGCHSSCAPGACEAGNNTPTGCLSCPLSTTPADSRYGGTLVHKYLNLDGRCVCPDGFYDKDGSCVSDNWVVGDIGQSCDSACSNYKPQWNSEGIIPYTGDNSCINPRESSASNWGAFLFNGNYQQSRLESAVRESNSSLGYGGFATLECSSIGVSRHGTSPHIYRDPGGAATDDIIEGGGFACNHNPDHGHESGAGTCDTHWSTHRRICKCTTNSDGITVNDGTPPPEIQAAAAAREAAAAAAVEAERQAEAEEAAREAEEAIFDLPHMWLLGGSGESCADACSATGRQCARGQWGVNDQASFEEALTAAGQSSSDQAALCSGGYLEGVAPIGSTPVLSPVRRTCAWPYEYTETDCSSSGPTARRLCRCAAEVRQSCDTSGTWYNPLGRRSAEATWQDCRQRALDEGMPYFNYFGPANRGCHPSTGAGDPTDGNPSNLGNNRTTNSGASTCI